MRQFLCRLHPVPPRASEVPEGAQPLLAVSGEASDSSPPSTAEGADQSLPPAQLKRIYEAIREIGYVE